MKTKTYSDWKAVICLGLVTILVQGCGGQYYAKAGLGWNGNLNPDNNDWVGSDQIGGRLAFGNRHHLSGNWWGDANFYHHSQPALGKPRNDDPETSSEHIYYDVEYWF